MTESVNAYLAPIREKRRELERDIPFIEDVLAHGNKLACDVAQTTLDEVREAMGMVY